jgi:hypothetical protein
MLRNLTTAGGPVAFDAPLIVAAGVAVDLELVDLNRDGKPDIASIDAYGSTLDIRLNTSTPGTLSFGAATSFATSVKPVRLAAVDADGTGGTDLVVLESNPAYLSLFENAMAVGAAVPAFGARVDRATGPAPVSVFAADLDGDSRAEIGVLGDDLWIYKNQSPAASQPSYEAARVLTLTKAAPGVVAGDLDTQPGTDLLVAGAPFTFLLNRWTPTDGFAFDDHDGLLGAPDTHKAVSLSNVAGIVRTSLDGVSPVLVATGSGGTWALYGD